MFSTIVFGLVNLVSIDKRLDLADEIVFSFTDY